MLTDDSSEALLRWRARLEATVERFDLLLEELDEAEADWTPDDGIASATDHVLQVADAARRLSRRLQDGFEPKDLDLGPMGPRLGEILRMLRSHHASILELLTRPEELTRNPIADDRILDLILDHLTLIGHHAAAIMVLRQLIDPSRRSALASPLLQFA